ncbi:DsbA family protein [Patescibacteria group bacterium]|nr:DsbA family protein [Patescibacteria group bacterium]
MQNTNNWLVAIVIVALLSGGIYWVYNAQKNDVVANGTTPTNTPPTNTPQLSEPISIDDWTLGPDNAQVQLVVFEDYQCPACRSLSPIFESMVDKYPGQVSYTYRHFQLDGHPLALPAALVAEAAGAQGKFWEMHNWLLANNIDLDQAYEYAQNELGLDVEQMKQEVDNGTHLSKINGQKQSGVTSGVTGTPSLYLNGKLLEWEATTDVENTVMNALQ